MTLLWLLACTRTPVDGPTVIWITVDTLRADHLGYAGHPGAHTPHIDALAARGRVFTHATTPIPRTTPALASALTALMPARHGSREVGDPIQSVATVAEAFRGAGWRTLGISAMTVAGPQQGLDRGFDAFEVHHDLPANALVARTLAALPSGPRFIWVHMSDPHFPYLPPEASGPCADLGRKAAEGKVQRVEWFANVDGRSAALLDDCSQLYDGEIGRVDQAVGALLEGIGGTPWVVFSADHGELLGDDGIYFEHGPTLHDGNLRIPLIVAGPGVPSGSDPALAQLQDLGPTSLALAGLPALPDVDGLDLLGPSPRTVATATSGSALQLLLTSVLVSGRDDRWCLNAEHFSWCQRPKGTTLHDRRTDPTLRTDVRAAHPDVAEALTAAAARWQPEHARHYAAFDKTHTLRALPHVDGTYHEALFMREGAEIVDDDISARLRPALPLPEGAKRAPRSEAELETLRALGYVE